MRIKAQFKTEKIPLGYRMMMVSLIKEALRQGNEEYYKQLYESGDSVMKPFSYAPFLHNFEIQEPTISLENLSITFSSPDPEFILYLYNGLLKLDKFQYQDFHLKKDRIIPLQEYTIRSNRAIFRSLSPLLIDDENNNPLSPEDPAYKSHLNYIADLILKNYRGKGLTEELGVETGRMKKEVIKENYRDFNESESVEGWLYFTGYKGYFQLEGAPVDLQLLYQLGLSKRRGQGFGFLELEKEVK